MKKPGRETPKAAKRKTLAESRAERKAKNARRVQSESAKRGAETKRLRKQKRSDAARRGLANYVARVEGRPDPFPRAPRARTSERRYVTMERRGETGRGEVFWAFSDALLGRSMSTDASTVRAFTRACRPFIGRRVVITFTVEVDGQNIEVTRTAEVFGGIEELARLVNSAARAAMVRLHSSGETYVNKVRLETV